MSGNVNATGKKGKQKEAVEKQKDGKEGKGRRGWAERGSGGKWKGDGKVTQRERRRRTKEEKWKEKRYRTDRGPWLTGEHAREWMLFDVNGYLAGRNLINLFCTNDYMNCSFQYGRRTKRSSRSSERITFRSKVQTRFVRLEIEAFFFFFFYIYIRFLISARSMNRYVVNYVRTTRYLTSVILRKFPYWYIVYTRASKVPDETQCVCDVQ